MLVRRVLDVSPFACNFLNGVSFICFSPREHSNLSITLEMGKLNNWLLHFRRICFLKMFSRKRRKWHFRDPKLKIFLGEHTSSTSAPPPRVWSAFVALFLLPVRTPSKSHLKRSNVELPFFKKKKQKTKNWIHIAASNFPENQSPSGTCVFKTKFFWSWHICLI